jgi:hypothetical protein
VEGCGGVTSVKAFYVCGEVVGGSHRDSAMVGTRGGGEGESGEAVRVRGSEGRGERR